MKTIKELKKELENVEHNSSAYPYDTCDLIEIKIETLQEVVKIIKIKLKSLKRYAGSKGILIDLINEIEGKK